MKIVYAGNRKQSKVALSFDDGPNPYATEQILEILREHKVHASFFLIGKRCEQYPQIVKKIAKGGHLIGNHTYSHALGDFEHCNVIIENITKERPTTYRPPYFRLDFLNMEFDQLEGKLIVTGDVNSYDYDDVTSEAVVSNVLNNTINGSIIDMHDGSEIDTDLPLRAEKTILALPYIIAELQQRGHILVRIDELDPIYEEYHP